MKQQVVCVLATSEVSKKGLATKCVSYCSKEGTWLCAVSISFYQICVAPWLLPVCRFEPTCSHYGKQALEKHGVCKGVWLTLRRLLRCHPWGGSGYDPI
ncbi:MAG TPA: membrane protein insertion efficiency factor YidD [Amoebophilaceae bacterium]|nr:membrane protein insertion efficiency factor YidD [Amoebophilaceae bacterium]